MADRDETLDDLLASERAFHDRRFENGDARQAQMKYYWAVEAGAERYSGRVAALAAGADILEYGCGVETRGPEFASSARSFLGIDISEAAIRKLAAEAALPNVRYEVMDAMNLRLPDRSLDLVYGSGIIHHLDVDRSMAELKRVLRPGGSAVFWEPLGHNPLINAYRWFTPSARTPDEHPLLARDLRLMRASFAATDLELYGLATIAAVPLRGSPRAAKVRAVLSRIDAALLRVPGVRLLAWYALIHLKR